MLERGLVCKLAYDWQTKIKPANQEVENKLFLEIWRSRIALHLAKKRVSILSKIARLLRLILDRY